MASFSEDGFVVTEVTGGISFTRNGGTAVVVNIPTYASKGLNWADGTFHKYVSVTKVGSVSEFSSGSIVWDNLKQAAAPKIGNDTRGEGSITTGSTSYTPVGAVSHYVNEGNLTIVNETVAGQHILNPGYAIRYLYQDGSDYYIATIGFGNGALRQDNIDRADNLWGDNVEAIRLETLREDGGLGNGRENREDAGDVDDAYIQDIIDYMETGMTYSSPLVLDLDGDGIETTSLTGGSAVYWDLDQDDFAEATGWVTGGDGLLALDKNLDGKINDSAELFGDSAAFSNGFLSLAQYDSTKDGYITSEDAVFSNLKVWIDSDMNGASKASELHSLSSLNITSINLGYNNVSNTNNGNLIKQESTFTINGNTRNISDVYFAHNNHDTAYDGSIVIDAEAVYLPNIRGYGNLPDLVYSTSNDQSGNGNLYGLVEALKNKTFSSVFDSTSTISSDIRAIMFRWAAVDGVSDTARGGFVNGKELGFLEKISGEPFLQRGQYSDPQGFEAGYTMTSAFNLAFNNIYARLIAQTGARELLEGNWRYSIAQDKIVGVTGLAQTKLDALETEAAGLANTAARSVFWSNVLRFIEYSVGLSNLTTPEYNSLVTAIEDSDAALDINTMLSGLIFTRPTGVSENGTNGADTINGTSGDDDLAGSYGNDTINGSLGNDKIYGESDNDILTGGTGGDFIQGGSGNDTYHYAAGDGQDTIIEFGSGTGNDADKIRFASGISSGHVTLSRVGNYDLIIDINTGSQTGKIIIENQFNSSGSVETLDYNGSSTLTLTSQAYTMYGSTLADTLYGITSGGLNTDTIYGQGGDDFIDAYAGVDTVYGGDGHDTIEGGDGNDILYGDNGNDIIYGENNDDTIYGGAGNDRMIGGSGNDTYHYISGIDKIEESGSGTEVLKLDAVWNGITPQYLRIGSDMRIFFDANNYLDIVNHFVTSSQVESLQYANLTTVNLTTITYVSQGTSGNDTMNGTAVANTMYGYGGNDNMYGANGNDIMYGGDGNDTIQGQNDNDTLYGEAGNDNEPPPIKESISGVNPDKLWATLRRHINGTEALYGGADYRIFAAG